MIISEALNLIKSGRCLTSSKFNSPDYEYIEYNETFSNPVRFISRDGYNSPIDLLEENDYRLVEVKTNNKCCFSVMNNDDIFRKIAENLKTIENALVTSKRNIDENNGVDSFYNKCTREEVIATCNENIRLLRENL